MRTVVGLERWKYGFLQKVRIAHLYLGNKQHKILNADEMEWTNTGHWRLIFISVYRHRWRHTGMFIHSFYSFSSFESLLLSLCIVCVNLFHLSATLRSVQKTNDTTFTRLYRKKWFYRFQFKIILWNTNRDLDRKFLLHEIVCSLQ